ncbi:DNA-3-methyladenine glycosylase family protein [Gryllotalpicola reticulitermitis]|uniref:DNA-3-methyladenine glycosylase II n=1 Tax=Gryllotalpicola reticulitermitis TaxID=1184153 RepID=A0ABV8Q840_9MICO
MAAVGERESDYAALGDVDPVLARLVVEYGMPDPFEFHDGGRTTGSNFAAMALHILGQQISTKVAFVLYDRLVAALDGTPNATGILELGAERIKGLGTSRAKAGYLVNLAEHVSDGRLPIEQMADLSDADAVEALVAVKGIGQWSAEMFLIHQLHRADILPAGDVGIRNAIAAAYRLDEVPTIPETRERGEAWAPWRTFASAILWRSLAPSAGNAAQNQNQRAATA